MEDRFCELWHCVLNRDGRKFENVWRWSDVGMSEFFRNFVIEFDGFIELDSLWCVFKLSRSP